MTEPVNQHPIVKGFPHPAVRWNIDMLRTSIAQYARVSQMLRALPSFRLTEPAIISRHVDQMSPFPAQIEIKLD